MLTDHYGPACRPLVQVNIHRKILERHLTRTSKTLMTYQMNCITVKGEDINYVTRCSSRCCYQRDESGNSPTRLCSWQPLAFYNPEALWIQGTTQQGHAGNLYEVKPKQMAMHASRAENIWVGWPIARGREKHQAAMKKPSTSKKAHQQWVQSGFINCFFLHYYKLQSRTPRR